MQPNPRIALRSVPFQLNHKHLLFITPFKLPSGMQYKIVWITITHTWNKYTTTFSYKCFLFQTWNDTIWKIQKFLNTKPKLENARGTKWHIFIRCWSELWSALVTSQLEKLEETKQEMTFLKIFKKWTILQSPNLKLKHMNWNIFWWWNMICIRDVNDNRDFNFFLIFEDTRVVI